MSKIEVGQIKMLSYISDVAREIHAGSISWRGVGGSEEAMLLLPYYAPSLPDHNVFLSWNRFSGWFLHIRALGRGNIFLNGFGVSRYAAPEKCAVTVVEVVGRL